MKKTDNHRARSFLVTLSLATLAMLSKADDVAPRVSVAASAAEAGMLDVQSLALDLRVEMRYASGANFVGTTIRGYEAARCYLLGPVAEALQRVETALREQSLRLKIFDCYRPVRAVAHFVEWVNDVSDQRTKPVFYPHLDKSQLLGDYISPTSGHSRGATLDLTLMRCDVDGRCASLDMGTDFDFFDALAHTDSPDVSSKQRQNRQLLRAAMEKEGFRNYPQEWWHYTFQPEPSRDVAFDFPIR